MPEMPAFFLDPWDEISTISRWNQERDRIKNSVGDLWRPDANGMTGYERLNRIAMAAPNLGSAALPMAQAGVDPDTDPIVQYAAGQAALMDTGWAAGWWNGRMTSMTGTGPNASSQRQQYRLRNATRAAAAAGLLDEDGNLHHPGSEDPHKLYIFGELRGAMMANRRNFEYVDEEGERRTSQWSQNPVMANMTNARMAHRMIESGEMPYTRLVQDGLRPARLAARDDPELMQLIDAAEAQGLINSQGILVDPEATSYVAGGEGQDGFNVAGAGGLLDRPQTVRDLRMPLFRRIQDTAQEKGIELSYLTGDGYKRGGAGADWYAALGPQITAPPQGGDRGGIGGVFQDIGDTLAIGQESVGGPDIATAGPGGNALEQIVGGGYDAFVSASRTGNMALAAPLQELQGQVRNFYAMARGDTVDIGQSQSDLGIAVESLISGNGMMDAGSGFSVSGDSEIHRERLRREAERGLIDGHRVTLGRIVASATPMEAGGDGYNTLSGMIDFGVAVFGDPTNWLATGAAKAGRARHLFAASDNLTAAGVAQAGGVRGLIDFVDSPVANAWLDGPDSSRIVGALRDETNAAVIARNAPSMPTDLIPQLADARTDVEIRDILRPKLGNTFRSTNDIWVGPIRSWAREHTPPFLARWNTLQPQHTFDWTNKREMFDTLDQWGRTVGVDQSMMDQHLDYILRAENKDEVWTGIRAIMAETDGVLDRAGVTNWEFRNGLIDQFESDQQAAKLWFDDEIASPVPTTDSLMLDDEMLRVGTAEIGDQSPHLASLSIDSTVTLPDIDAIRRMVSNPALRFLTTKGAGPFWASEAMKGELRFPILAVKWASNEIWKPVTLARLAWTLRVIGEEQLRMAATPMIDSMFNHPLSYLAYRIGQGSHTRLGGKIDDVLDLSERFGKGAEDFFGNPIAGAEQHRAAMSSVRGGMLDDYPWRVRSENTRRVFNRESRDFGYVDGWGTELVRLHQDPISNRLVNTDLEDTLQWLMSEGGRRYRERLALVTGIDVNQEELARAYLAKLTNRVQYMTGGNTDLLDAIRTGQLNGRNMVKNNGLFKDRRFVQTLQDSYMDDGPQEVIGQISRSDGAANDTWMQIGERWRNQVVENMFSMLMTNRTNNLSRSPFFVQAYWRRMAELTPYVLERDALRERYAQLPRLMREHGIDQADGVVSTLGRRFRRRFEYQLEQTADEAQMISIDEADTLAKDYALQSVQKTLFDVSRKTNWEVSLGIASPFISAWKEVFSAWKNIAVQNPRVIRRGFQALNAAQESGFFYTDEQTGELMFTYPGSQFVTETLTDMGAGPGVPIPLSGRAAGLNFMSQVVPGIGPALQIPVTFLMAGKPEWQEWYERAVPFGAPAEEGLGEALNVFNYAPPWVKRFFQGVTEGDFLSTQQDHRTYMNTIGQVARYLMSTGEYDSSDPGDMQRLLEDARTKARVFFMIRSGASFAAPSAPSPQWLIETDRPEGLMEIAVLTEEYRLAQDGRIPGRPDVDFTNADEYMLDKYGDEIVLALTPFSRTISWGLDPSQEFYEWSLEHDNLREDYSAIYGLFGPQGDFDIGVFASQFRGDDALRKAMTPEKFIQFSQHLLGQRIYDRARQQVGLDRNTPEGRDFMRDTTEYIHAHYPGWRNFQGLPGGVEDDVAMRQLRGIIEEDEIRDTPLAGAVSYYLSQRDAVVEDIWENYQQTLAAQSSAPERDFLNELATYLIGQTPEFERVFDMVLSRELEGPAPEEGEEGAE